MNEVLFQPVAVPSADSVPVRNGQFVLDTSTGYLYVDWNGQRYRAGYAGKDGVNGKTPSLSVNEQGELLVDYLTEAG